MTRKVINLTAILCLLFPGFALAGGVVSLPQTGQTTCYNTAGAAIDCAGTRQDGQIRAGEVWPNPRFTLGPGLESDCVTDNLTGLMWPRNANLAGGTKNWNDAVDYTNLILCGHSDWRLPSINELESLLDSSQTLPALPLGHFFINVQPSGYWSSTTGAFDTTYAWFVNMGYASVDSRSKEDGTLNVWPVRLGQAGGVAQVWKTGQTTLYRARDDGDLEKGASWPSPRFVTRGDCVIDNLTALMWSKDANPAGASLTWQQSLDYANSLTLCGHSDWRLPNRKELLSLVDRSRYSPALPPNHPFFNVPDQFYWSSTTYSISKTRAWLLSMRYGNVSTSVKSSNSFNVWPVRTGQANSSLVWPVIAMTPLSGPPGTSFEESGAGLTPEATATLHFKRPDNTEYPTMTVPVDGSGNFRIAYATPTDLPIGIYTWWAVDDTTGVKSNELSYMIEGPKISLKAGWNFISLAKAPLDPSANAVLFDISPNVRIVWGFDDVTKSWLKWKPSGLGSTLLSIDFGKGYWVYMDASASLAVNGADASPTVQLSEGWNIAGYAGTEGIGIANGLGAAMDGKWSILWSWTDGQWYAKHPTMTAFPVPVIDALYQGRAYWIRMKEAVEWQQ